MGHVIDIYNLHKNFESFLVALGIKSVDPTENTMWSPVARVAAREETGDQIMRLATEYNDNVYNFIHDLILAYAGNCLDPVMQKYAVHKRSRARFNIDYKAYPLHYKIRKLHALGKLIAGQKCSMVDDLRKKLVPQFELLKCNYEDYRTNITGWYAEMLTHWLYPEPPPLEPHELRLQRVQQLLINARLQQAQQEQHRPEDQVQHAQNGQHSQQEQQGQETQQNEQRLQAQAWDRIAVMLMLTAEVMCGLQSNSYRSKHTTARVEAVLAGAVGIFLNIESVKTFITSQCEWVQLEDAEILGRILSQRQYDIPMLPTEEWMRSERLFPSSEHTKLKLLNSRISVSHANYYGVCNRPVPSLYELAYVALGGSEEQKQRALQPRAHILLPPSAILSGVHL